MWAWSYYGDNLERYSILKGKSLINNAAIISNKLSATSCTTDCDTKVDKQFPTWSKMQQAIESNREDLIPERDPNLMEGSRHMDQIL